MTRTQTLYARTGAAAIAAVMALSPTYAASPKPIIDLSKSPAISGEPAAPTTPAKPPVKKIGPVDERTAEIGGGAIVILALGGAAIAMRRRKRRRDDEEAWNYDAAEPASDEAAADEPMTLTQEVHEPQPAIVAPAASAFAWGNAQPCDEPSDDGSDRCPGETWVERAYRGRPRQTRRCRSRPGSIARPSSTSASARWKRARPRRSTPTPACRRRWSRSRSAKSPDPSRESKANRRPGDRAAVSCPA